MDKAEHVYQAQKFLDLYRRHRGHWEQAFAAWADSKSFTTDDRAGIWAIVDRTFWVEKENP